MILVGNQTTEIAHVILIDLSFRCITDVSYQIFSVLEWK
jgi:hypothetical protein